jgi:hypothetical protein
MLIRFYCSKGSAGYRDKFVSVFMCLYSYAVTKVSVMNCDLTYSSESSLTYHTFAYLSHITYCFLAHLYRHCQCKLG